MIKEDRFDHILRLLKQKGKVTYNALALDLKVSEDTSEGILIFFITMDYCLELGEGQFQL